MVTIDNILLEWSYRCNDGIVDVENQEKVLILQEILKENNIELIEEVVFINEVAADIKQQLIDAGYDENDIIIKSSKQIRLLTKGNERKSTMDKLLQDLPDSKFDINFKGSSLGAIIANDGTAIIVKPREKQGGGSAGLDNEQALINGINEYASTDSPIKIIFVGSNKTISFDGVTLAQGIGADTAGGKKSDVALLSGNNVICNLSLKKANASMWESADRRYKELMIKLSDKLINDPFPNVGLRETEKNNIYRLYNPETGTDLSGIIINNLPDNDNEAIIFGTDKPKVNVIKHTFQPSDFNFDNGILTIKSGIIFTDLEDIEGTDYEPILIVRHDVTRTATKGLRPVVYNKSQGYRGDEIKGSQIALDYNQIF
jgi:hypothetical protein